ncbi:hypothetical protein QOZ80_5BG0419020 [Eleusine coracana subsp. coracana]|nr:hypothetical protein QOZ80_5BG0419020 [Eleusine coracana subsp. coracana]
MASVSSQLAALCNKIQGLAEPGTDMSLRHVSMACICIATHNLGNAAVPSRITRTRKSLPLVSTLQFRVDNEEYLIMEGDRGFVYKVHHRMTGKAFASLPSTSLSRPPFLVRFYAIGKFPVPDQYFLLMEHVGPSLREVLTNQRRGKPFREHEVCRMMRQVMNGAKEMHDRGIVHRGIHPENVLVVAGGGDDIKIGGFGQATCTSETEVPPRSNTMCYCTPPDVLLKGQGALGSELVDSWLIGCLMAELLTVKVLFEATDHEDESDQLHKIFGVLGVPDKEAMKDMKPQDLDLAREVSKWRARRRGAGKLRSDSTLRKLVPSKVLSNDGFEVLQGLLTCNPRNRLTAVAALQLPWFANDDSSPGTAAIPKQIVTVGY